MGGNLLGRALKGWPFVRHFDAKGLAGTAHAPVGSQDAPRRTPWRLAGQFLRPLGLVVVATLGFAMLLRLHHGRFEEGLVRSFQGKQLDNAKSVAALLEEHVNSRRKNLQNGAGRLNLQGSTNDLEDALAALLRKEKEAVTSLAIVDQAGVERCRVGPGSGEDTLPPAAIPSVLRLDVPIERDGRCMATLRATLNMRRITAECLAKSGIQGGDVFCLVSADGMVISGGNVAGRQVVAAMANQDAPQEPVHGEELNRFVATRCAAGGHPGLARTHRSGGPQELVAFCPVNLPAARLALVTAAPEADVSVPIASHERVTYTLFGAMILLYFATGYSAYRADRLRVRSAEDRRRHAEQASKAKGNYLAQMSHELRTPMNGIIGMAEMALAAQDDNQRRQCLAVVKESAFSLLSVVNDVLDLSKIEAGKLELCPAPFNLCECIVNTVTGLAPLAKGKGLCLRWEIDQATPLFVSGDAGRLRQILVNVVGNAIKFTQQGEVLVLVAADPEGQVTLSVRDTGTGMSQADLERIFDPYERGSNRENYRTDGTGLGLAIAKQLVQRMGGTVQADSRPGEGTTISCTIPFAQIDGGLPDVEGGGLPSMNGLRAVAVSATPQTLQRLDELLNRCGARASAADAPAAAIEKATEASAKGEPFDLVILDGTDLAGASFDCAAALRNVPGHAGAVVCLLYWAGFRGDALRCLQSGIDAYLPCSVSDEQLTSALRTALRRSAAGAKSLVTRHSLAATSPLSVLLVDDNPVNRQVAVMLLDQWGHRVVTAQSGEQAVATYPTQKFDIVLMDLEMPGINGIEAATRIRQLQQGSNARVPIIAMTAHALDEDRQRCLQAGMDDYLSKPVRPEQLRAILEQVATAVAADSLPALPEAPQACDDPSDIWDRAEALGHCDDNEAILGAVVQAFLEDCPKVLSRAQEYRAGDDPRGAARWAHRLKGTVATLGAHRALRAVVLLEESCGGSEPERISECVETVVSEVRRIENQLRRQYQGVQS